MRYLRITDRDDAVARDPEEAAAEAIGRPFCCGSFETRWKGKGGRRGRARLVARHYCQLYPRGTREPGEGHASCEK